MNSFSKAQDVDELTDEERFAVRKGVDAARGGQFAPDDEMETFYRCHCDRTSDGASEMQAGRPKP